MAASEYKSTVLERLSHLLKSGIHSDVQFSLNNGDTVKGHRLLFAISSPVFDAMMFGGTAEKEVVEINDLEPEGFKTMTEFIYTDKLNLNSVSHAISTYIAGDKYQLPHLEKLTEEYIIRNVKAEDTWEVLEFSKLHSKPDCEKQCMKLVQEETESVLKADGFLDCSLSMLEEIVNEEKLNIAEVELFQQVEKWAKHYSEKKDVPLNSLRPLLNNVITKIRFLSMSITDFISSPNQSDLFTNEEKLSILANIGMPNSMPLPDGICKCVQARTTGKDKVLSFSSQCTQLKNIVKWRKKEISKIEFDVKYCSPTFYINNHPLRICFQPNIKNGVKQLGLFLLCHSKKETHGEDWSFNADYTFQISRKNALPKISRRPYSHNFCYATENSGWGPNPFLKWNDFVDGGYIEEDDSVLIEVTVELKE